MTNDTICALATAPGGALGIIRVSGPAALPVVSTLCSVRCDCVAANTVHYTHILYGSELIDECMVSVFRAPHSYTGEDSVELSCHGSPYILNKVLSLLVQHGCRMAHPGEFTQRAYLGGKLDLSQAEAVADLIASTNRATHQIAMSQLRGHFSSELATLREQLLKLTFLLELELDFSDHEDLEFADRSELLTLAQRIDARITALADSFERGQALKNGIPVAIVGKTNVGKSTLLNALLGDDRAIVSDIHGTTRDTIEDTIDIQGVTFRFIDTAGIRHTTDTVEQIGIDRSLTAARRARIILMVTEPGVPYPDIPVRDDQTVIHIINKIDTPEGAATPQLPAPLRGGVSEGRGGVRNRGVCISAKHNIGLDALRAQLSQTAPQFSASDVIVTNARHYDALTRAHAHLQRVIDGLNTGLSGGLLAEDLRLVLDTLAEITGGQITPQETLNTIFSHFCVGK